MSANQLTTQILQFLYERGAYGWRQNSGGVFDVKKGVYRFSAKKGVSDILAVLPPTGRLLAIEVKIGKDRLSPEQLGFIENVRHAGGFAFVVHDFEEFLSCWNTVDKAA